MTIAVSRRNMFHKARCRTCTWRQLRVMLLFCSLLQTLRGFPAASGESVKNDFLSFEWLDSAVRGLTTVSTERQSVGVQIAEQMRQTIAVRNLDLPILERHEGMSTLLGDARSGQAFCPFPLLPASENNTNFVNAGCGFRCTGTMVTSSQVQTFSNFTIGLSSISFILSFFIFATWGLFGVKAQQKMTFWVSFCSVSVTSSVFFPALVKGGTEDVWCKDDLEGFRQSDGFSGCVVQGAFIIFFGLSLCGWWFCSCFDIFSKLFRRKRNIQHYLTYYHFFSWGIATLNTAVLLFGGRFGYNQPRLWCFLNPETPNAFEFIFFYGWVGLLWFFGTIMMILVLWSIFSQTRSYRRQTMNTQKKNRSKYYKKLSLYRTPIVFVTLFSFFWATFFSFVFITELDEQAYIEAASTWFLCLFTGLAEGVIFPHNTSSNGVFLLEPAHGEGIEGCGEFQPGGVPIGLLATAVFCLAGNGILIFLIFGPQYENFRLWRDYIGSCFTREKMSSTMAIRGRKGVVKYRKVPDSAFKEKRLAVIRGILYICSVLRCEPKKESALDLLVRQTPNRLNLAESKQEEYNANYQPRYVQSNTMLQRGPQGSAPGSMPLANTQMSPGENRHHRRNQDGSHPGQAGVHYPQPGVSSIGAESASASFSHAAFSAPMPNMNAVSHANYNNPAYYAPNQPKPDNSRKMASPFPSNSPGGSTNRYVVDSAELSQPPPGVNNYDDEDGRYMSSSWSDIYDDPLWGINVEF